MAVPQAAMSPAEDEAALGNLPEQKLKKIDFLQAAGVWLRFIWYMAGRDQQQPAEPAVQGGVCSCHIQSTPGDPSTSQLHRPEHADLTERQRHSQAQD